LGGKKKERDPTVQRGPRGFCVGKKKKKVYGRCVGGNNTLEGGSYLCSL